MNQGAEFFSWIDERRFEIGLLLTGIIIAGIGVFLWKSGEPVPVEVLSAETETASDSAMLIIDISGAVNRPGVYKFVSDTRVESVISEAGGFSAEADTDWVDANINRAEKVLDGQKIYIPKKPINQVADVSNPTEANTQITGKISLNKAGVNELDTLPGVGPVTAQKILAGRPYQTVEDLLTKKIVSQKVYSEIKELVSLW